MESLDQLFEVFSKERRRYALYALDRADGPIGLEELAERVRQWESDGNDNPVEEYERVVLTLKHTHLPTAAQLESIEYDRDENEIRISGEPEGLQIILAVSEALERPDEDRIFDPHSLTTDDFFRQLTAHSHSGD